MRSAVIYNFLIEANIMASIAILLMILLRKLLRKPLGNSALCFGWLLTAIRLLCPLSLPNPFIHEIRPAYIYDMTIRPIAGQIKIRLIDAIIDLGTVFWRAGNQQAANDMQKVAIGVDYNGYPAILAWIWMAGCILVLLWFVFRNIQFRKAMKNNRIEEISGELKEMYLELCMERKVKPVPVYFTDPVSGACLVGIFSPYIVLPVITSPQDVKNVLVHEICHLKNKDHIWNILRLLCCAIHWFNPLVWLAASMSRTDCELRCDDRVTALMDEAERKDYANVLVFATAKKSMPGIGVMATGMTMTGKRLKNRVMAIVQNRKPIRVFATMFMVIASACMIGAFATSEIGRVWKSSFPDNTERTEWTLDPEMLESFETDQESLDAYAAGLWLSPSLKEEAIHMPFSILKYPDNSGWQISDRDDSLLLTYDGQGILTGILNQYSGISESAAIPITERDTPVDKLSELYPEDLDEITYQYLGNFLQSIRPDLLDSDRNYPQFFEERRNGETYFAMYALRRTGMDALDDYLAMIGVEMYPEIRVVQITTVPDQMRNPGNG